MSQPFLPSCQHRKCLIERLSNPNAQRTRPYPSLRRDTPAERMLCIYVPIPSCPKDAIELHIRRFPDIDNPFPTGNAWELLGPTPADPTASYWIGGYGPVTVSPLKPSVKEWKIFVATDETGDEVCTMAARRTSGGWGRWARWTNRLKRRRLGYKNSTSHTFLF